MAHARIYRDGKMCDCDTDQAIDAACKEGSTVWLDVELEDLPHVAERLGFHQHAVEDAMKPDAEGQEIAQRTKLDRFPGHIFLYLYRTELDDESALVLHAIPAFVNKRVMVTVSRDAAFAGAELVERFDDHQELLKYGTPALVYALLDLVSDSHLATIDTLAGRVDDMEDLLFDDNATVTDDKSELPRRSFVVRKSLVRLRRVTQPMRELVQGIMRREEDDQTVIDPNLQPYFQDVYDHTLRATDTLDGLRDLITTIYETRLALADHTLNTVMKQLTAWAAIIAVPTAVTGFYGQNVPYPGFGKTSGFLGSTVIWVGISVVLYVLFKRKRWL